MSLRGGVVRTIAGAAAGFALAQADIWPNCAELAWVSVFALAVCLLTAGMRTALLASFACGMTFWYTLLGWATLVDGRLDLGLSVAGATIALLESAYFVAWGFAVVRTRRLPMHIAAPALALQWGAGEVLRTLGTWAMPYGELGASQSATAFGAALPLIGTTGLSVLIAGAAYVLARLATETPRGRLRGVAVCACGLALGAAPVPAASVHVAPDRIASVAIVRYEGLTRADVAPALDAVRRALRGAFVDLVMLPEGALAFSPDRDDASHIGEWAGRIGAPIVAGAALDRGARWTNSTLLFRPQAPALVYDKEKLVPFGEFVPARDLFGPIVQLPHGGFVPGKTVAVWRLAHVAVAPLICFEVGFGELARRAVSAHADAIIVPQNDTWFSAPGGTALQAAVSAARARSLGVDIVLAAARGPATVVHGDGTVEVAGGGDAVSVAHIAPAIHTPYARFGDAPLAALAVLFALCCVARTIRTRGAAVAFAGG